LQGHFISYSIAVYCSTEVVEWWVIKFYTVTFESSDSEEEPNTFLNSEEYVPTEEDKEYKGWRHLIPFRRRPK